MLLILVNTTLLFGINYLIENKNLQFGYRLESTDLKVNSTLYEFNDDESGYSKLYFAYNGTEQITSLSQAFAKFEKYNLDQNLQFQVDLDPFLFFIDNIDNINIVGINQEYIVEIDKLGLNYRNNGTHVIANNTIRNFIFYQEGIISRTYEQHLQIPENITSDFDIRSDIPTDSIDRKIDELSIMTEDYFVILERTTLDRRSTNQWSIFTFSLIYFNLKNNEMHEIEIHSGEGYLQYKLIQKSKNILQFLIQDHDMSNDQAILKVYEIDLSSVDKHAELVKDELMCSNWCSALLFDDKRFVQVNTSGWKRDIALITPTRKYQWSIPYTRKDHNSFHIYYVHNQVIQIEQSFNEGQDLNSVIKILQTDLDIISIPLLKYDNYAFFDVFDVFELNGGKIGIVVGNDFEDDLNFQEVFHDIQVLILNPKDTQGLILSNRFIPHLLISILLMIPLVIKYKREPKTDSSDEIYPVYDKQ